MSKRKILIQLDSDAHPSVFDRVVAIDAGADEVFSYGGVKPEAVAALVDGAIFTRGTKDLKSTAIFVGGSDVTAGERLLQAVLASMQPQSGHRVSVLLDSNGANTTAAAAVRAVTLLPRDVRLACPTLRVAVDLNAVEPLGIEGVEMFDRGTERGNGVFGYGALGVGGTKMKIHRAAVARLFESNDQVLDA